MQHASCWIATALLGMGLAFAQAPPPAPVNYQGVLRDASDDPLDGTCDMRFLIKTGSYPPCSFVGHRAMTLRARNGAVVIGQHLPKREERLARTSHRASS